jgi:predicted nucleic acid-binding protein
VIEAVLDASVVLKWFRSEGERNVEQARALRASFEAGELSITVPSLLMLEILNVAARRWGWGEPALVELSESLSDLGFDLAEPDLPTVAHWAAKGLTAYDAAYVAVAEQTGILLITDDDQIAEVAPVIAQRLANRSLDADKSEDDEAED